MSLRRHLENLRRAIGKGVFPEQFSWLLELRARRLLLSPARLAARMPVEPHLSVLEVGAGSGFYSIDVARRLTRGRLSLVDVQPGMLQRCRAKAAAAGLTNVAFVVSDAAALPFASAAFDLVYLVAVLGEIRDADAAIAEVRRVLRPAGVLSVSEHLPDPDFTTRTTLRSRLHRCGFSPIGDEGPWWAYTSTFCLRPQPGAASE
ncbi:MAG: class I SAM-dependent methyltransferase [Gemmatimonadaceae bacterium]|jgi:ubiquinone/menaquinone biosynthesis C-methylase UbiE|nr:class I SAM-dependent methyltransferase [Gemmatimonadaceae bacterium]